MAILLYANGLTEEVTPIGHAFTDDELISNFESFNLVRSYRLSEVPNTWCLWGQRTPIDKLSDEFNHMGTDIIEQPVFSPILFIHDTEIEPTWKLTDDIINVGYVNFKAKINGFFNYIAKEIMEKRNTTNIKSGQAQNLMTLEESGISVDKRIIFKFDMDKQSPDFFKNSNFAEFAKKAYDFLKFSYKDGDIFAIFADKNIIIVMSDPQIKSFIDRILEYFQSIENYEACSTIRDTYGRWILFKNKKSVKKELSDNKRPKKIR